MVTQVKIFGISFYRKSIEILYSKERHVLVDCTTYIVSTKLLKYNMMLLGLSWSYYRVEQQIPDICSHCTCIKEEYDLANRALSNIK